MIKYSFECVQDSKLLELEGTISDGKVPMQSEAGNFVYFHEYNIIIYATTL